MALDPREWLEQRTRGKATAPKPTSRPFVPSAYNIVKGVLEAGPAPAAPKETRVMFERAPRPGETARGPFTPLPTKVEETPQGRRITLAGGEQFILDASGRPVSTPRAIRPEDKVLLRNGTFAQTRKEVDHKIPKALGGTEDIGNLQALKNKKTISQTVFDFLTRKKRNLPSDYKPQNRQEGKMVIEHEAIRRYESGVVTLSEARAAVINWQDPDIVESMLGWRPPESKAAGIVSKVKETARTFVERRDSLAPHLEALKTLGRKDTLVDPQLAARLRERGETERLRKLEEEAAASVITHHLVPAVQEMAVDIARMPFRSFVSIALPAASGSLGLQEGREVPGELDPGKDPILRFFLGEEKVEGVDVKIPKWIETGRSAGRTVSERLGLGKKGEKGFETAGAVFAVPIGAALMALDFTPFGGGSKKISKEAAEAGLRKFIAGEGKALTKNQEDQIRLFASRISKTTDPKTIEDTIADAVISIRGDIPFADRKQIDDLLKKNPHLAQEVLDGRERPISGTFGPTHRGLDVDQAVKKLLDEKTGEAVAVAKNPHIGTIDLVYGKAGETGYGLAHIAEKHPEILQHLDALLNRGRVIGELPNRKYLGIGDEKAVISLDWKGDKKSWVLTAYVEDPARRGKVLPSPARVVDSRTLDPQGRATIDQTVAQPSEIVQEAPRIAPDAPRGIQTRPSPEIDAQRTTGGLARVAEPAQEARLERIREMGAEGRSVDDIARTVQTTRQTVRETLQEAGILPTDEVRAALKKDRMESVREYLKGHPLEKHITDPQNVIPTKAGPIDPDLATPRLSVFEEITMMRRDVEALQKSAKAFKTTDQSLRGRISQLENSLKTRERDYLNTLETTPTEAAAKAEEEMRRKFRYETVMVEEFADTEMEAAFHRFRKAAARRPWMLDAATDDALLKQKLGDRLGNVDDLFFQNGSGMTNDEMLDVFKARIERIKSTPKPDLKFLRTYEAAEKRLAEVEGRLDDAFEKLKEVQDDREALQAAIKAIEDKAEIIEETRKAVSESMRQYRDIGNIGRQLKDIWRNTKNVFQKDYEKIKKLILDPLDDAKGAMTDEAIKLTDELDEQIVKKLGIKANSKESAAVQLFGEGLMTESELVVRFGQKKADDIKAAADWFRRHYDDFLDDVNEVRRQLYPNNPDKLIPKRKDYFRHFQEMEGGAFDQLLNIFETPAAIDPRLVGISRETKPKSKFLSFAQRREGTKTKVDAVGGYLNYVRSMTHAKHIDPAMARIRDFRRDLAEATVDTKNLNTYLGHLDDFANQLAGKTASIDRILTEYIPGGRKTVRAFRWVDRRVKANLILGKFSNLLVQGANIPQVAMSAGRHLPAAAAETVAQLFKKDITPIAQSRFLKERFKLARAYERFDSNWLKVPLTDKRISIPGKVRTKAFARWITSVADEAVANLSWNAEYRKAVAAGNANPVRAADEAVRSLIGGRGIGEVPALQATAIGAVLVPFMIEAQNLWWVQGEQLGEKRFGKILALNLYLHLFNRGSELVLGRDVVLDPIGAVIDSIEKWEIEEDNWERVKMTVGRLGGEVLSNVYGGQHVAELFTSHLSDEERTAYLGETDPRRFGGGILSIKELQKLFDSETGLSQKMLDPVMKLLLPFGGQQIKTTIEGVQALSEGETRSRFGSKFFDVELTPENILRAVLFGKYSVSEAKPWRDESNRLRYFEAQETIRDSKMKREARRFYNDIKDLPKEDVKGKLRELSGKDGENEELVLKVLDIYEKEKLGLTSNDLKLKGLDIGNGMRARAIVTELNKLKTKEDKKAYLRELARKKILTDDVLDQVLEHPDRIPSGE